MVARGTLTARAQPREPERSRSHDHRRSNDFLRDAAGIVTSVLSVARPDARNCYNCGSRSHNARDCTQPNADALFSQLDAAPPARGGPRKRARSPDAPRRAERAASPGRRVIEILDSDDNADDGRDNDFAVSCSRCGEAHGSGRDECVMQRAEERLRAREDAQRRGRGGAKPPVLTVRSVG